MLLNALIVVLVEQEVTQTKENDSLSRKSWRVLFVRPGTILVNLPFPFYESRTRQLLTLTNFVLLLTVVKNEAT